MQDSEKIKVTAFPHDNVCLLYTLPRTLRDSTGYLYEIALDPSACLSSHTGHWSVSVYGGEGGDQFLQHFLRAWHCTTPSGPRPGEFYIALYYGLPQIGAISDTYTPTINR